MKSVSEKRVGVQTSVGLLAGVPGFDVSVAQNGTLAMLVTPSVYVDLREPGGPKVKADENRITGTVQHVNQIGQVIHVDERVNDALPIKLETHREKIVGKGVAQGAEMDLCWKVERSTIVMDAA